MGGGELAGPKGREGGREGGKRDRTAIATSNDSKRKRGREGGVIRKRGGGRRRRWVRVLHRFFFCSTAADQRTAVDGRQSAAGRRRTRAACPSSLEVRSIGRGGRGGAKNGEWSGKADWRVRGGGGSPASSGGGDSAAVGQHGRPAGPEKRGLLLCRQRGDGKSGKQKGASKWGRSGRERERKKVG